MQEDHHKGLAHDLICPVAILKKLRLKILKSLLSLGYDEDNSLI